MTDKCRFKEFANQLRNLQLSIDGLLADYDRLLPLHNIYYLLHSYLQKSAQKLHDETLRETKSTLLSTRYLQLCKTEFSTIQPILAVFRAAYGEEFLRELYEACYALFTKRQEQALKFLQKSIPEHKIFSDFHTSLASPSEPEFSEE